MDVGALKKKKKKNDTEAEMCICLTHSTPGAQ